MRLPGGDEADGARASPYPLAAGTLRPDVGPVGATRLTSYTLTRGFSDYEVRGLFVYAKVTPS